MAIDTERDRASVVSVGRPWKRPRVITDGILDQADRQQIGNNYAGVLVSSALLLSPTPESRLIGVLSDQRVVPIL